MSQPEIKAEKINSPIQLMAAWFVMPILLSSVLLTAASHIEKPEWASGYLVAFTTILITGVVSCVLLMLTKFRPNLQDGKEYAEWLKDQNRYTEGFITSSQKNEAALSVKRKIEKIKSDSSNPQLNTIINEIENSILYRADIANLPDSNRILSCMKKLGFEASIYEPERESTYEESTAIWLGSEIPPSLAVPAIKKAVSIWPQLKYIHLSSDAPGPDETHWSIFIGGSTKTAEKFDNLKPWSNDQINQLEVMTVDEFHRKIRSNYP